MPRASAVRHLSSIQRDYLQTVCVGVVLLAEVEGAATNELATKSVSERGQTVEVRTWDAATYFDLKADAIIFSLDDKIHFMAIMVATVAEVENALSRRLFAKFANGESFY